MISMTDNDMPRLAEPASATWPRLALIERWSGFEQPTCLAHAGDGTDRLFVAERAGRVLVIEGGVIREEPFLDLRGAVRSRRPDEGLTEMCFRSTPGLENKSLHVLYTPFRETYRVSGFTTAGGAPGPERQLMQVSDTRGVSMAEGPEGRLWLAVGSGRDGGGRAFGSLMRQSDRAADGGWEVRSTEPRCPRGLAFDRLGGRLFMADHGEDGLERVLVDDCRAETRLDAIVTYPHCEGAGVLGGRVYRGRRHPSLRGVYIHADSTNGQIWGLRRRESDGVWERRMLAKTGSVPAGLWEDEQGEVYATTREGAIYEVAALDSGG